ncbi:MAG: class II fructose-bisphosphate aldolase [Clostridiales bacterium]|nr:class II fructose-bisphosphate aldolase [Clostridiales bacterium]
MAYVTAKKMLLDAQKGSYAVGAFNAENMEMLKGIIQAAEELRAPVMIGTTSLMIQYGSVETYAAMVRAEAEKASVPVCLHLDHGNSYELAVKCVANGYGSVMIDGSALPYEENIAVSRKVAGMADVMNVPTEAELGRIGGNEDQVQGVSDQYTSPEMAKDFVARTGIFSLAVAIGTAHGFYKETPVLDLERLKEIRRTVDIPLVLHGASGLTDDQIRACAAEGICKVNFATELRCAYSNALRACFEKDADLYDPKEYGVIAIQSVKDTVMHKILACGSNGAA